MTFSQYEPREFHRFLDKFRLLDQIKWTEDLIARSICACCTKLTSENIINCWMDFSINKYMHYLDWSEKEAVKFIYDKFEEYAPGVVGLVLSLKYESPRTSQRKYASLINDPDIAKCLVGIDLVGDENYIDSDFHLDILKQWKAAGKMTRAHVGELGIKKNVAFVLPYVTNIAHGLAIVQDKLLMKYAIDHDISFDMGLTSNMLMGIPIDQHPILTMLNNGLSITIGTDDPVICNTDLNKEYLLAKSIGVSNNDLETIKKNAVLRYNIFR